MTFWAGTTVPLPSADVSTRTCAAGPITAVSVPESPVASKPETARMAAVPVRWAVKVALLLSAAATKSPSTTPLVLFCNDQESAATFATKLL